MDPNNNTSKYIIITLIIVFVIIVFMVFSLIFKKKYQNMDNKYTNISENYDPSDGELNNYYSDSYWWENNVNNGNNSNNANNAINENSENNDQNNDQNNVHVCTANQKKGIICTQIYDPVCAYKPNIRCITTPCNYITYPNACQACHDPNVYSYTKGACPANKR